MKKKKKILLSGAGLIILSIIVSVIICCRNWMTLNDNNGGEILDENGKPIDTSDIILMPEKLTFTTNTTGESKILTVQACLEPMEATNQKVLWSIRFSNSESNWAKGKTTSDYITLTSSECSATIQCLKPFGETMILKCVSEENSNAYAECTMDYLQRGTDFFPGIQVGEDYDFSADGGGDVSIPFSRTGVSGTIIVGIISDAYTLKSSFQITVSLQLHEEFIQYLEKNNCMPKNVSVSYQIGDKIDLSLPSLIKMFGLSPDRMNNTFSENKISELFYRYNNSNNAFIFNVKAINDNDPTNVADQNYAVSTNTWNYEVPVTNVALNTSNLQF